MKLEKLIKHITRPLKAYRLISFNIKRRFIIRKCENYNDVFECEKNSRFSYTKLKAKLSLGYDVNIDKPKTFNEKLIHRRLFSRDPIWPVITDKIAVRSWLEEKGYLNYVRLVPAKVAYSIDDLMELEIDRPVVVKAAWASGMNLFINSNEELQLHKATLESWLASPYTPERLIWAAENMNRGFLVEDSIADDRGIVPLDYKFFCFNGVAEFVQIDLERFSGHRRVILSRDGTREKWSYVKKQPESHFIVEKELILKMRPIVELMSKEFSFLRVDLYLYEGEIYFGELTQTPHAGFGKFTSKEVDLRLGELWEYPGSNKLGDK